MKTENLDCWSRQYKKLKGKLKSDLPSLHRILDLERSRNQRQGSEYFSREVEFMRWFPIAFLTSGVFIVAHGGIELTTPAS